MSYAKQWGRETPLRDKEYAWLLNEYVTAADPHYRYLMASLVSWHVPAPWKNWRAFWRGMRRAEADDDR